MVASIAHTGSMQEKSHPASVNVDSVFSWVVVRPCAPVHWLVPPPIVESQNDVLQLPFPNREKGLLGTAE